MDTDHIIEQEADAHRIVDAVYRRQQWFPQTRHRRQMADMAIRALRDPFADDSTYRIVIALIRQADLPDERQRFATLERAAQLIDEQPQP